MTDQPIQFHTGQAVLCPDGVEGIVATTHLVDRDNNPFILVQRTGDGMKCHGYRSYKAEDLKVREK